MPELIETYWPWLLVAFAIGLAVAWFVFVASRKTSVVGEEKRDVLDEGAAPAARNQALIDAPPAAGALSQAANTRKVAHAGAVADAEAGASVAPSHPEPTPQASAAADKAQDASATGDDLTRIKGLGPKLSAMLETLGVTRYEQIAGWDDAEIERIDSKLGRFQGRIRRDAWVEQARLLAAGDETGFSEKFGRNG